MFLIHPKDSLYNNCIFDSSERGLRDRGVAVVRLISSVGFAIHEGPTCVLFAHGSRKRYVLEGWSIKTLSP